MTREFFTLSGGQSLLAGPPEDAPPADLGRGRLAGALAQQHRSALVALACPDLPPSALSGRGLHLQAQQRARCALGRHERACVSGYRPHLRAAATARAVMAVHAGLAPDEAAQARERQIRAICDAEDQLYSDIQRAVSNHDFWVQSTRTQAKQSGKEVQEILGDAYRRLAEAVERIDARGVADSLSLMPPKTAAEAEARQQATLFGRLRVSVRVGFGGLLASMRGDRAGATKEWIEAGTHEVSVCISSDLAPHTAASR